MMNLIATADHMLTITGSRDPASLTHGNSPLSIEQLPERGVNMGALSSVYTAVYPRGVA